MKVVLKLVLLLSVVSGSFALANESDQLKDFVNKYEETWQSHDAKRLADYFADNADMIVGIQPRIVGREAIESWWSQYFSRIDSGRVVSISIESISNLSPNIALLNVHSTTGGTHSKTREVMESRKARGTWVVVRVSGNWKIAALRMHSPVGEIRDAPGTDN
jgi:uncharacterized protein (TIGR02246 family)